MTCHFCHRAVGYGPGKFPSVLMTINGAVVEVCDVCAERGQEAEGHWQITEDYDEPPGIVMEMWGK